MSMTLNNRETQKMMRFFYKKTTCTLSQCAYRCIKDSARLIFEKYFLSSPGQRKQINLDPRAMYLPLLARQSKDSVSKKALGSSLETNLSFFALKGPFPIRLNCDQNA